MKKEEIATNLEKVVNTLNIIEVKGRQNMDYLLGCINVITKILEEMNKEEDKK